MSSISGSTRVLCLLGDPVDHSKSPAMYNTAFEKAGMDYVYLCFNVKKDQLKEAFEAARALNFPGFSLTMPLKLEALQYVDELSPAVELMESVNTVRNDNGHLTGYNTDGYGMMESFRKHGASIKGEKMTLMGIGGAGTAVACQGALDGLEELSVFSPKDGKSWGLAQEKVARINEKTSCKASLFDSNDYDALRKELASSNLVANCTPIGMGKLAGKTPIPDASFFHKDLIVQDAVYAPAETEMLRLARQAGCTAFNGTHMLYNQGVMAFDIWTGKALPLTQEFVEDLATK